MLLFYERHLDSRELAKINVTSRYRLTKTIPKITDSKCDGHFNRVTQGSTLSVGNENEFKEIYMTNLDCQCKITVCKFQGELFAEKTNGTFHTRSILQNVSSISLTC